MSSDRLVRMSVNPSTRSADDRSCAAAGLLAVAIVTSGCSSADGEPAVVRRRATRWTARVLPQLAPTGEDIEAADDADWVVDATVADVEAGTTVTLVARPVTARGRPCTRPRATTSRCGRADHDADRRRCTSWSATATTRSATEVSTADAPRPTFTDDFDEDSVDEAGGTWFTRDQGYSGVRTCSRADAGAAEVARRRAAAERARRPGRRRVPADGHDASSSPTGSTATSAPRASYGFTYGFAAARIKTQSARGQHSAFWMQAVGGQPRAARRRAAPRSTSWSTSATTTPRAA